MAKRGREAVLKRQREKARQEKRAMKLEKRNARSDEPTVPPIDEESLMEEFARLSEQFETGDLDAAEYEKHRHRIFTELGITADG